MEGTIRHSSAYPKYSSTWETSVRQRRILTSFLGALVTKIATKRSDCLRKSRLDSLAHQKTKTKLLSYSNMSVN